MTCPGPAISLIFLGLLITSAGSPVAAAEGAAQGVGRQRIPVIVFLNKGCPGCGVVERDKLQEAAREAGQAIDIEYYDLTDPKNYERLVETERALADTGNDLPVVVVGTSILGGSEEIEKHFEQALAAWHGGGAGISIQVPGLPSDATKRPAHAEQPIQAAYFYQPGCSACSRAEQMLSRLRRRFPTLEVHSFAIDDPDHVVLLEAVSERLTVPAADRLQVPVLIVGNDRLVLSGLGDDAVEATLARYRASGADSWWTSLDLTAARARLASRWRGWTVGAVVVGGLVDGVNPCAFAVLVLFVSMVAASGRHRPHMVALAVSFIAGVFCTYFLIGIGLSEAVTWVSRVPGLRVAINWGIAALCLALAFLSLRDAVKAHRGEFGKIALQLPATVKARVRAAVARFGRARYLVPAGFMTGALISGLELVCTGQVYLPVIRLMTAASDTTLANVRWLLLYNVSFILPLAGVFALAYFGTTSEQFTAFLRRHLAASKLLLSAFFVAMAGLVVVAS